MPNFDVLDLWRTIAGPQPGLLIPSSIRRQTVQVGPWFQAYVKFSELERSGEKPSERLFDKTRSCDGLGAVGNLALINNFLLVAPTNLSTHTALTRYLSPEQQNEIKRLDNSKPIQPPNYRVVFNRIGCLVAIKLLLTNNKNFRKNALLGWVDSLIPLLPFIPERKKNSLKMHEVGELALLTNDVLKDELADETLGDDSMMVEFLGNWDISNTSDIAHAMSRADRMVRDHLLGSDTRIARLRDSLTVNLRDFDGCSLEEHQALTFGTYAVMADAVREHGAAVLKRRSVAKSLKIPRSHVHRFFRAHSLDSDRLLKDVLPVAPSFDNFVELTARDEFLLDMRPFRARPFLKLGWDRLLVLDLEYVVELSTAGLYWHLGKHTVSDDERKQLPTLWGYVFENYCGALLEYFYPDASGLLQRNLGYDDSGEKIDALVDLGSALILFEFKSSKLRTEDIRSRDQRRIESELAKKYVAEGKKPKGIGQLVRDSQAIVRGKIPAVRRAVPQHVFPVLVTEERLLESFGVNRRLNETFRHSLDPELSPLIRPLTVMSVEELEFALPYVQRQTPTWPYLLSSRFEADSVRPFSVYQSLWDLRKQEGLPNLRNEYVFQRWDEIFGRIKPLLRS